tara:strand:+ start:1737 stop:2591 length:855 start_codon:yes stop_codon:yes gene_type:complete
MTSIHRYDEIDIDKINYSKPEKIGTSYFASMSYGDNLRPLYIQTPKLNSLIDFSSIKEKKSPYLDVEIPSGNYDIYDFFLSLDDKNIKTTVSRSNEWFQREIPLEAIDDMYKRSTKPFKKNANPTLRFKLPIVKNQIQCGVYNQQRVFIDLDEIKEGVDLILILHVRGLKVLKQYFYCDCYVSQIKVFQENKALKYNIISEYSMVDNNNEKEDDIFDQEILDSFKSEEEKKEKEIQEIKLREEKEKKEKIERENKIKEIQDEIEKNRIEMEKKRIEMEKLLTNN